MLRMQYEAYLRDGEAQAFAHGIKYAGRIGERGANREKGRPRRETGGLDCKKNAGKGLIATDKLTWKPRLDYGLVDTKGPAYWG